MHYNGEHSQAVKAVRGLPAEWGACLRTVKLDDYASSLAHASNTIAVGLGCDIIILDGITGSQTAILCGHTKAVKSIVLSTDGKLLVSGSNDTTIRLWDLQTGGDIRKLYNNDPVCFMAISVDCTRIASASLGTVTLWDAQTGGYLFSKEINHPKISFSPLHPRVLIVLSESDEIIQWDIDKDTVEPISIGPGIISSLGNTLFARHVGQDIIVQSWESKEIIAQVHISEMDAKGCCFSPDLELIAVSARGTIGVWNIVGPNPHHIATLDVYHGCVTFSSPSSLVSIHPGDRSVKFWTVRNLSTISTATDPKPTTFATAPIVSVSLQARDGIIITSNSNGVVEIWDLLTGLWKTSFQTPATEHSQGDAKILNGVLTFAWGNGPQAWRSGIHVSVWESRKSETHQPLGWGVNNFIVSGDGSKVFLEYTSAIKVWSVQIRELVGEVKLGNMEYMDPLHADGSRIWIRFKDLPINGWDFEPLGSPPTLLSNTPLERPYLDFIDGTEWGTGHYQVKNTVTGKEIFRLSDEYTSLYHVKWDGQYLVAEHFNGEFLVLDFGNLCSQ